MTQTQKHTPTAAAIRACEVLGFGEDRFTDGDRADAARTIDKATGLPDLLAALERLVTSASAVCRATHAGHDAAAHLSSLYQEANHARAALAKAKPN